MSTRTSIDEVRGHGHDGLRRYVTKSEFLLNASKYRGLTEDHSSVVAIINNVMNNVKRWINAQRRFYHCIEGHLIVSFVGPNEENYERRAAPAEVIEDPEEFFMYHLLKAGMWIDARIGEGMLEVERLTSVSVTLTMLN